MKNDIQPQRMLKDIGSMRRFALQLSGNGKDYDLTLNTILKKDYYYDHYDYPLMKDIQSELKISPSVLRRHIKEIYADLENITDNGIDYTINQVDCIFFLSFLNECAVVKLQNIPYIPRQGEDVRIPFFNEKVSTDRFYVRSVSHEFTDAKQIVYIQLVVGQHNLYWDLLRDEEYAKGKMSWDDYDNKRESQLRKRYNIRWL